MSKHYPCHPYEPGLGGVKVWETPSLAGNRLLSVAVFDPLTDEPCMWAVWRPEETGTPRALATLALTRHVLFERFPHRQWYIGRPWEGRVRVGVGRRDERRASGIVSVEGEARELLWRGEIAHTAGGLMWRYHLDGWPEAVHPLDTLFLGRVLDVVHGCVSAERSPVSAAPHITNVFTAPPLPYLAPPWRVAGGESIWVKLGRRGGAVLRS